MGEIWIADISSFDAPDGPTSRGRNANKVRFLGQIVSAASLMATGEYQVSSVQCRRRPQRRRCPGKIRLGRDPDSDEVHWTCPVCGDRGVVTNWRDTRWDLSQELKKGHIISLSEERARRAGRPRVPVATRAYEMDVELVYAPVVLEERVVRQVRLGGEHSLHDLHRLVHRAFDRGDEEAYEFMFGPPYDPDTQRFAGSPEHADEDDEDEDEDEAAFEARFVLLDSLDLKPGDNFGYLFDFSDEWIHRLTVTSVKNRRGREVIPQVIGRSGESPPQLPTVEEFWDDELFWHDMDASYPLTGLYGPYRADHGVDRGDWLALDDLERHLLVLEAHSQSMPKDHPRVETMMLHAVVHVLAESHLAAMSSGKARTTLEPLLQRDNGCRHSAIHRLGERLLGEQLVTVPPPRRARGRKPGLSS